MTTKVASKRQHNTRIYNDNRDLQWQTTALFRFEHSDNNSIRHGGDEMVGDDFGADDSGGRASRRGRRYHGGKTSRDPEISQDDGKLRHRSDIEQHQTDDEPHQMYHGRGPVHVSNQRHEK